MPEVRYFVSDDGEEPFAEWFENLERVARARVARSIDRMEQGNLGDSKSVGEGVFECRLDLGPGYRVYFGREGDTLIILLAGGTKRRQQRDIDAAQERWRIYRRTRREQRQGRH